MTRSASRAVTAMLVAIAIAAIPFAAEAQARRANQVVTVGVVADGSGPQIDALFDAIKKEVTSLSDDSRSVTFPPDKFLRGSFTADSVKSAMDRLLDDPEVDMVYALGVLASNDAGARARLAKPVIAPFIIDRGLQGLPFDKGTSGRRNLNYIDWPWSVDRDIQLLREVAKTDRVVFMGGDYIIEAIPNLGQRAIEAAAERGVSMTILPVGDSLDEALNALPADTSAVYLAPLVQLAPGDRQRLHDELTRRKIATFSIQGEIDVRAGALCGRRPSIAGERIARRVALNTQRILTGTPPAELPVAITFPERLMINLQTAQAIGLSPSWAILTEAELINPEPINVGRELDLEGVVREALDGNVNIKALEQSVIAGRASVRNARSNLLPRIDLDTDARVIDEDRAQASFGSAPQVLWTGGITLSQVILSEPAWAGYSVEQHLQQGRVEELEQTKLDIVNQVGVAYLTVLRAKTAESIQRGNLKLTRVNLDLARTRVDAGSGSRADVFRWESQIASDRKATIDASAQRRVAETDLARILNRSPEEQFAVADIDLSGERAIEHNQRFLQFVGDPWTFRIFREFLISEAVKRSPEIKILDAAIAAQTRLLESAKRSPYTPTVAVSANATQRLYRGGAGSSPVMETTDGLEWFVGLNLSLPLYVGGSRYAEIERNDAEVVRLNRERDSVRDQIAQRTSAALHQLSASFAGIQLSQESADAAGSNYEIVAASYAQGAVTVVVLLDAQNAWLQAQQRAADSVYDFLIDWLNVQRAVAQYDLMLNDQQRAELAQRALDYITERRQESGRR